MAKFNQKQTSEKINLAGGKAYAIPVKYELISALVTSFADNKFYEKAEKRFERVKNLIDELPAHFVAKALLYTRNEVGMRSISHIGAFFLAKKLSTQPFARTFWNHIIRRPDDMTEIVSLFKSNKQKLPNALKRGFADAFERFDAYQLAKYRGEGRGVKLVDIANVCHPKPTEKNGLSLLMKGELKNTEFVTPMMDVYPESVLSIMGVLEQNPNALIEKIENIGF